MTRLDRCLRCQAPIFASIESPGYTREGEPIRVIFFRCTNGHTCAEPGLIPEDARIPREWLDGYRRCYQNDVDNEDGKD